MLNLRFVALGRPLFRLLRCPFQLLEQARDMSPMIAHAKLLLNHPSHAGTRPEFTAKTVGFGSLQQQFGKGRPFRCTQPGYCPGMWMGDERLFSSFLNIAHPLAHR
jgi:hypothetical protein